MLANFSMNQVSFEKLIKTAKNSVTLYINNKPFTVTNPDPETYLIDFLRAQDLTGTKLGCGEGGCLLSIHFIFFQKKNCVKLINF